MQDCQMPAPQIEHIIDAGFTSIALLAHGVHEESKLEEFIEYLSLIPSGETFRTFSPQSASIRRVVKEAIAKCVHTGREAPTESPTSSLTKTRLSMVEGFTPSEVRGKDAPFISKGQVVFGVYQRLG